VFKDRESAVSWDGHEAKAEKAVRRTRRTDPSFGDVARGSWALVEAGTYASRRGQSKQLSGTTVADYRATAGEAAKLIQPLPGAGTSGALSWDAA
jgi:hypothetical protein